MTQTSNRLLDEFSRLMTDAASVAQGVKREAETAFRSQAERWIADLDLVKREDFDAMRDMVVKARADNEALTARVAALEARIAELGVEKPRRAAKAAAPEQTPPAA